MADRLKIVLLSLLLVLVGVSSAAAQLPCTGMSERGHACCAHMHRATGSCQKAASLESAPSCCKAAPALPRPTQTELTTAPSAPVANEASLSVIAEVLPPLLQTHFERQSRPIAPNQSSPTRALLCSFLI